MAIIQDNGVVSLHDTLPGIREIFYRNAARSPLLRLPPEIRLSIYTFVVSCPYQAVIVHDRDKGVFTEYYVGSERIEANVLQCVCKMTRSEKRRLEYKVNHVAMNEHMFAKLTLTNNWRLQQFSGTIVLKNVEGVSMHPSAALLHGVIFKYARENPRAKIRVIIADWTLGKKCHSRYFLCLGWIIEWTVRRKETPIFPGIAGAMRLWKGTGEEKNLDNITFHPSGPAFDWRRFRCSIRGAEREFVRDVALRTYEDEEALTEAVRGWHKDGI